MLIARQKELPERRAGLICTGNIPIDRAYIEKPGNVILDPHNPWDAVSAFKPSVAAAKSHGAVFLAQLQHPGMQCPSSISKSPKSSSDVQLKPSMNKTFEKSTALTIPEIKDIVGRYVWASKRLAEAGADGIIVSFTCLDFVVRTEAA